MSRSTHGHADRSRTLGLALSVPLIVAGAWSGGCSLPRLEADQRPATGTFGEANRNESSWTRRRADGVEVPPPVAQNRSAAQAAARQRVADAEAIAQQGDIQAAIREFEEIIAENPTLSVAYLGAGDLYMQQGDLPSAESRFARAAQIEPQSFDAQYKHGLVLQLMQRTVEAIRAYLRALAIRPNDYEANLNVATSYLQIEEPAQALPYARRAVELRPGSGEARINLGAAYAALGRHAQAVVEYRQASEYTELTPELLLNLAESLGQIGNNAEMAATLEQVIRIEPTPEAHERLGAAQFRLKRYDEALTNFRRAVELDPMHYPAWNGLAVSQLNAFLWSGERDEAARQEALRAMRQSLRIEPNQPRIVELLRRYG